MQLRNSADIRQVMEKYTPMVYRLAYARTGNHSDAEDICQEVFLALARKNPNFEAEENRKAWLIRVTMNRTINLYRSNWHRRVTLGDEADRHAKYDCFPDQELSDALAALPEQERALLQLHYFEGMKSSEIADIIGNKPATVRKKLVRARNRLKKLLMEEV